MCGRELLDISFDDRHYEFLSECDHCGIIIHEMPDEFDETGTECITSVCLEQWDGDFDAQAERGRRYDQKSVIFMNAHATGIDEIDEEIYKDIRLDHDVSADDLIRYVSLAYNAAKRIHGKYNPNAIIDEISRILEEEISKG